MLKKKNHAVRQKKRNLTRKEYATRIAATAGGVALLIISMTMFRRGKTLLAIMCLFLSIGNIWMAVEGLLQLQTVLSGIYVVLSVIYNTLDAFFSKKRWYKF